MFVTWNMIALWAGCAILMIFLPAIHPRWIFYCLLAAFLGDLIFTLREPKFTVVRHLVQPAYQHREHEITVAVTNPMHRAVQLYIKDEPPFEVSVNSPPSGWLAIAPGETALFSYRISAAKRGTFFFANLNIRYSGRLGLFCRVYAIPLTQRLDVYPDLEKLNYTAFNLIHPSEVNGEHRRKIHSLSGEFSQLREFTPGDDLRKVNWKVTAHFGKPIINEFEPEKDQTVFLCFDTGRLMYDQLNQSHNRMDYLLDSAILLSYQIIEHGDMVGALGFNAAVTRFVPPGKGKQHLQLLINQCYDLQASLIESDYHDAFTFLQNRLNKRCLLFVYTDILELESSQELVAYLKILSRRHLVVCVMLRKDYLKKIADLPVTDETSAFQKGVALDLIHESRQSIRWLSLHGITILEADPGTIAKTVTDHYLYLKRKGLF